MTNTTKRKTKKVEPITNLDEIREILVKRFNSSRGETGEELRSIATAPIHNEQQFVDVFNIINSKSVNELDLVFDTSPRDSRVNYKLKLLGFLTKIGIFNKECTDIISQMKLCIHYPKKTENLEYFTLVYGAEYAKEKLDRKANRVLGENNPAFNHGGTFSPFSKNFVKYENLEEEEVQKNIQTVTEKARTTIEETPENQPTRIEYYLSRGLGEEDARKALSERQSTFSLEKCIQRHGEEEGHRVWKERQDKWQASLNNLPEDQKYQILRKKAEGCWKAILEAYPEDNATVYLMATADRYIYKFGITTNLTSRISTVSSEIGEQVNVIASLSMDKSKVFDIETKLCEKFFDYSLFKKNIGTDLASGHIEYFCDIDESTAKSMWLDVVLTN